MDPIFDLTEATFIEACWYVQYDQGDWLAIVYRPSPEEPWQVTTRFRTFGDADAVQPDDDDRFDETGKDGTTVTRDRFVTHCEAVATHLASQEQGMRWKVLVRGTTDKLVKRLAKQPWAHVRITAKGPSAPQ